MRIDQINIDNFRGLSRVKLNFDDRLTVLVGENGAGKTSILDALSILLSQYVARLVKTSRSAAKIEDEDIKIGSKSTKISLAVRDEPSEDVIGWSVLRQGRRERLLRPRSSESKYLSQYVRGIAERQSEGDTYLSGETAVIYYDQRRAVLDIPQRKRGDVSHIPAEAFAEGLQRKGIDFRKLTYWFQERETDELRRKQSNRAYIDVELEAVRRAMTGATGFKKPHYSIERPRGLTFKKKRMDLHVGQLSSGEQIFLAIAGDLARRLAVLNKKLKDPLKASAVVLIDEVELHLHPRWQRRMLPWLLETFPGCQFIVTTHSPQVLGEVRSQQIRMLSSDGGGRISVLQPTASFGRDSNYILLSVLGADERRDASKKYLAKIDEAIEAEDLDGAHDALEDLRSEIEGLPPELTIAEARIARRRNR